MLIWVIALHCEAKPVIDLYRLKKKPTHHGFDLYQNQDMQCVISGIGKINAAAATAWVAAVNQDQPSLAWINLGTAGAAEHALGSIFWVSKISQEGSSKHLFPVPTFTSGFAASACVSLSEPSTDYQSSQIFDMEASAFFATATRFSSAEQIHCLKVISDNQQQQTGQDKTAISNLISPQMPAIGAFIDKLQTLNRQMCQLEIDPADWRGILGQSHFSQTQQARLKTALRFLLNRSYDSQSLREEISGLSTSREILKLLDQLCFEESRNL
jgi:adenosylhomocysteine nucleosidase